MKQLLVLLLAVSVTASAQKTSGTYVISLDPIEDSARIPVPFAFLKVLDARYSREYIGCVSKDLSFKGATKFKSLAVFPETASVYLPRVLHKLLAFDPSSPDTLAILIKQFRLTDHTVSTIERSFNPESVLTVSLSFYKASADGYSKIFSVDGLIAETWDTDEKPMAAHRNKAVCVLLRSLFQNKNWAAAPQTFSASQIEEGIQRRLNIPLFGNNATVAGVYRTFEEFKNNAPSIFDIKVGRSRSGEIKEVLDANGKLISSQEIWGLCDGKERYISFQQGFHRLMPGQNNFRIAFYRRRSEDGASGANSIGQELQGPLDVLVMPGFTYLVTPTEREEFLFLNLETGQMHVEEVIGALPLRKFRSKSHQY